MKRTVMNEDGKEFMKLILSVIVIVLCSGCFRNNSPISVELSSVERNDTSYLEFEFTNNTEDGLYFVFDDKFYIGDCGFVFADYGSSEKDFYAGLEESRYNVRKYYQTIVVDDTLRMSFPDTDLGVFKNQEEWPCIINMMRQDYERLSGDTVFNISEPPLSIADFEWLDKDLFEWLSACSKNENLENERFMLNMPSENTVMLMPNSSKTIEVDVSYLKYIKAVYSIKLDYTPAEGCLLMMEYAKEVEDDENENDSIRCLAENDHGWFLNKMQKLGYKKYTERLTSNAITIDTRNMKLP